MQATSAEAMTSLQYSFGVCVAAQVVAVCIDIHGQGVGCIVGDLTERIGIGRVPQGRYLLER